MSEPQELLSLTPEQISALSYENARDMLNDVVQALDDSSLPLSDLMKLWEIGNAITKVCEGHLSVAAEKLNDGLPSAD